MIERTSGIRACILAGIAAALTFGAPCAVAQGLDTTGRWEEFEIAVPVTMPPQMPPTIDPFFSEWTAEHLYFHTPAFGFGEWSRDRRQEMGYFRTLDSGKTWQSWSDDIPMPHAIAGRFGVSESGARTTDSGHTWTPLMIDGAPVRSIALPLRGSMSSDTLFALYGYRPTRLAVSYDFGASWRSLDSVVEAVIENPASPGTFDTVPKLQPTTQVGTVPGRDTTEYWFEWAAIPFHQGELLYTVVTVSTRNGPQVQYLWRRDLDSGTNELSVFPFHPQTYPRVRFLSALHGYGHGGSSMFRTTNAGREWDTVAVPETVNMLNVRFASPRYGISLDGYTTDFGETWHAWGKPVTKAFHLLDSTHLFGANGKTYYRSTDGGRSWIATPSDDTGERFPTVFLNVSPSLYLRVGDDVIVSDDDGESWRAFGKPEALPHGVVQMTRRFLPHPDTRPQYIVGYATVVTFEDGRRTGVFESTDAGLRWTFVRYEDSIGVLSSSSVPAAPGTSHTVLFGTGGAWRSENAIDWQRILDGEVMTMVRLGGASLLASVTDALLKSTDEGSTWDTIFRLSFPYDRMPVLYAVDGVHLVGYRPHRLESPKTWIISRSSDGGNSWWSPIETTARGTGPNGIPLSLATYYRAYGQTIEYSLDSGETYQTVFQVPQRFQSISTSSRFLFYLDTATMTIGRWRLDDPSTVSAPIATRGADRSAGSTKWSVGPDVDWLLVPHPADRAARSYAVLGIGGDLVRRGEHPDGSANIGHLRVHVGDLPAGVYVLRIDAGEDSAAHLFSVVR